MHSRDLPAGPALVDSSPADLAERLHLLEIRLAELSRAQDRRQNSLALIVFSGDRTN